MSEQLVEVVRSIFDAFNRRDLASMVDLTHPDLEWRPAITPGGLEGNTYRGHAGVRQWLSDVAESWETMEAFDVELKAVGAGRVLALGHVERELAQLWELADGKGRRAVGYPSHKEAVEAARLAE